MENENTEILKEIDKNTEINLLQGEKIIEAVDGLEPALEGILVKAGEISKEVSKFNENYIPREMMEGTSAVLVVKVEGDVESIKGPEGEKGTDAPPVDEDALAQRVFEMIPIPKDGEPGKDVDEDVVVDRVLSLMPIPKDGKDADEDKIVSKVLKKVKMPEDGYTPKKGVDYFTKKDIRDLLKSLKETKSETRVKESPKLHLKDIEGVEDLKEEILKYFPTFYGSGKTTFASLDDVNITGITDQQSIKFDSATGKFVAYTPSGGGGGSIDGSGTANELSYWVDPDTLGSLSVATYPSLAELAYVKGVTSALQTQLNSKEPARGADDNYVTDAQLVVIGNTSGTNTGDQTLASFSVTSSAAELNILDGATLSTAELNFVDGVTSSIQTQLNTKLTSSNIVATITNGVTTNAPSEDAVFDALALKAPLASPTFTGTVILPKTLEIQDTSADHQYVLAVSELAADRTVTFPLLTGNDEFVFKDHIQTLTNKSIVATQLTGTAYTFPANNTSGTTAMTLVHYENHDKATYAGTFTWNSTAPTTITSQQYAWSRIGNTVTLTIGVLYSVAGTTNTTVSMTLPSDCPTPADFVTCGDAASEYIYPINGARVEGGITGNPSAVRGGLKKNAANNGYEIALVFGSASAIVMQVTVIYRTA